MSPSTRSGRGLLRRVDLTRQAYVESYRNDKAEAETLQGLVRAQPLVRILRSRFRGPASLQRGVRLGPDVDGGRFLALNEHSFACKASIGKYCTFGARISINPFQHPVNWLTPHELSWHAKAFDYIPGYGEFRRLPWPLVYEEMRKVTIGNDVWMGHNVNVMGGVAIGDGAIIGAGAVVTHDVPAYAIMGGVPARVLRFRFSKTIIRRLLDVKWWDLPFESLSGLPFNDIARCVDRLERIRGEL